VLETLPSGEQIRRLNNCLTEKGMKDMKGIKKRKIWGEG
jgi:hypothetical protein